MGESVSKPALVPRQTMCATCPFRDGSEYAFLRDDLAKSAVTEASRICHSTGPRNAINRRPKQKKARACRGARDLQLRWLASIGFLDAPTDEAWAKKWKEMQR
jgi:hypothetical protein